MSAGARKKVLLMDDSSLVLDLARGALEDAGYTALVAHDLEELERVRATDPPDLVLLDVQMPEAFGDDIGMVLREGKGVAVPILLFSSLGDRELAQRAREAGVDGFISKRAGLEVLIARVREILEPGTGT